jgi:hypothetical protein
MSDSVFNLAHVFVVFHPGTGGNFICNLLDKLINKSVDSVVISSTGSSHNLNAKKTAGVDYLSFGTEVDDHLNFDDEESRINFYLNKITEHYSTTTDPQVVWTHDFTNIPVYKKFFPNSKILVITQDSVKERLVATFMNITKTFMDKNADIPLGNERWNNVLNLWKIKCKEEISRIADVDADKFINDRFNPDYFNLVLYASFNIMLVYYQLFSALTNQSETSRDVANRVLTSTNSRNGPPYVIGKHYNEYITDDCIKLPYSYLLDNDVDTLIQVISTVVDEQITGTELEVIKNNFVNYRSKQNQLLLENPTSYYLSIKEAAHIK